HPRRGTVHARERTSPGLWSARGGTCELRVDFVGPRRPPVRAPVARPRPGGPAARAPWLRCDPDEAAVAGTRRRRRPGRALRVRPPPRDRKSTRLNSSHVKISYAVFCLKKKKTQNENSCYL